MADDVRSDAPPVGEEVHLPGPTILPLLVAVAFTIGLVGVTLFWPLTVFGLVVTLCLSVRWIRETRRDVAELPLEH
jgi:Flp pilus assembly protein TadB